MCARQIYRNFLITLLLFAFLSTASHLFAATRGIRVVSKQGHPLYLYKDYHAVVIGVSDYDHWPKLPNAVKDAEEVSETLKLLGFQVRLVSNPTYQQFRKVLNNLTYNQGREPNRALLFYYAGHGETETMADGTKLGYIIPRDCPLLSKDPQGFVNRAISMKDIEAYSLRIRSKHFLMLFDSCFSGSLFSMVRAVPEDISEKSSQPVRQYITAGTEEEQVPDKSMFKRSLLVGLEGDADLTRDGYITGSELGLYLADKVVKYTKGKQHPQYGKINNPELDRGDFVFVPRVVERVELTSPPEDERHKLAYLPKTVKSERVSLRKEARKLLSDSYIKNMVRNYNFYEKDMNPFGSFTNDLVDNGDGTVTDKATGLMWQKSGSTDVQKGNSVRNYVRQLNRDRFAGHSNWRLPTIDELASLLEKKSIDGFYLDPIFDRRQEHCWTADTEEVAYWKSVFETWAVNFKEGRIKMIIWSARKSHLRLYTEYDVSLYIRAVRSLEN